MREPVSRNPVPSLLRSLMSEHLDPGYAAASASRRGTPRGGKDIAMLVLGAVLVGCVLGIALSQVFDTSGGESRQDTLHRVRDAESRAAELDSTRQDLSAQVDRARDDALRNDDRGTALLTDLRALEVAAGADSATGPGIVVTVAEPPAPSDLSDVSVPVRGSSDSAVLDRDLQTVVNSLWVSGAEAIAVDDVRVGPGVTIRQAGGAMLVDNRPVFSPYTVTAIGSPTRLEAQFSVSDAYLRMAGLAQLYRIGFATEASDSLSVPPAAVRAVTTAGQDEGR